MIKSPEKKVPVMFSSGQGLSPLTAKRQVPRDAQAYIGPWAPLSNSIATDCDNVQLKALKPSEFAAQPTSLGPTLSLST